MLVFSHKLQEYVCNEVKLHCQEKCSLMAKLKLKGKACFALLCHLL